MIHIIYITRLVILFIFSYSFVTKLSSFTTFEQTIRKFQLVPQALYRTSALFFMFGELLIVLTSLIGGFWLFICYSLAILLLSVFIYALSSVLNREIQISCNCFGMSEQIVSVYDIWRNVCITFIAFVGLTAFYLNDEITSANQIELLLSGIIAIILTLLLLNLRDFLELVI